MRTDTPPPPSSPVDRLRAEFQRARRRLADRAPAWGRGLAARRPWTLAAAAVLAAVAGLALLAGLAGTAAPGGFVRAGERFSRDDLARIRRALDAKRLTYRVDAGRVEVAADKLDDANDVVAALGVGPRPLDEIEKQAAEAGLFDTPGAKEQRLQQARNEQLASMIRRVDGVADARVWVRRPVRRLGQRVAADATAFVYLETVGDRELDRKTVEDIVGLVSSFDPDVRPDAVSLFDRGLQRYAVAHDPAATATARDRAREGELGREIASRLDWIKGVQVSVRLVPAGPVPSPSASPTGPPVPAAALPPLPPEPTPPPAPAPAPAAPAPSQALPSMAANQPLDLSGDEPAAPAATEPAAGHAVAATPAPAPAPAPAKPAEPAPPPPPPSHALVWVKVPRSYYLHSVPGREPSLDELHPLMTRVETLVTTAVRHVVPSGELGEVTVSTIPDEVPAAPPPMVKAEVRPSAPWWVLGGVGVGAGGGLVLVLARLAAAAARRPALRPASRSDRGRYKIDEAPDDGAGPGPSERVRELIRLNPEAAASVLHRWTGQGGPIP